jgi:hypothetical protein
VLIPKPQQPMVTPAKVPACMLQYTANTGYQAAGFFYSTFNNVAYNYGPPSMVARAGEGYIVIPTTGVYLLHYQVLVQKYDVAAAAIMIAGLSIFTAGAWAEIARHRENHPNTGGGFDHEMVVSKVYPCTAGDLIRSEAWSDQSVYYSYAYGGNQFSATLLSTPS